MGEHLGVTFQQVGKYASGENELALKTLFVACQVLKCKPSDIYPEIEMFYKGLNVTKTQTVSQNAETTTTVTNHHYYNQKSNFFVDFFANIKLLDINSKGALLFKIAVFIIVLDNISYTIVRALGKPYTYFIFNAGDHLSQLMGAWIVFTWPISLILPLLIKHWLVYIIPLYTFKGVLDVLGEYVFKLSQHNVIDAQSMWLIKTGIALIITLTYAYIVKKYLRKNS